MTNARTGPILPGMGTKGERARAKGRPRKKSGGLDATLNVRVPSAMLRAIQATGEQKGVPCGEWVRDVLGAALLREPGPHCDLVRKCLAVALMAVGSDGDGAQ